jgi:hypothetical protein
MAGKMKPKVEDATFLVPVPKAMFVRLPLSSSFRPVLWNIAECSRQRQNSYKDVFRHRFPLSLMLCVYHTALTYPKQDP